MSSIENKIVVITGASSGLSARRADRLATLAEELGGSGSALADLLT